jgi:dynein heavy chain, axonemal
MTGLWVDDIKSKGVPISEGVDPLKILATEADMAGWSNEGLPTDRVRKV